MRRSGQSGVLLAGRTLSSSEILTHMNVIPKIILLEGDESPPDTRERLDTDKGHRLIQRYAKPLARLGVPVTKLRALGSGSRGVAYGGKVPKSPIGRLFTSKNALQFGDKVLKVTNDLSEAKASMVLMNINAKHLPHVYNVFQFGNTNFYGIVLEKLEDLSADESLKIDNAIRGTVLYAAAQESELSDKWKDLKAITVDAIRVHVNRARNHISDSMDEDQVRKELNRQVRMYTEDADEHWNTLESFGINEAFEELQTAGIKYHDYHSGNIMKRSDGTYVVIDLGYSKLPGGNVGDPMKLEGLRHLIRNIVSEVLNNES